VIAGDTQGRLLAWFAAHQRRLPWRAQPGAPPMDPYRVVVSEFMLQQTRVETVLGYFDRWCERFPTLTTLAAADESEVLAAWTGLGYYTRARNLHKLARATVDRHAGKLPNNLGELRSLPGIGPYTAAAVLSIAFGQPAALVDGNVARVLARWHGVADDVSDGAGKKAVWRFAASWLENGPARADPGAWNQALMELGAMLCAPRQPACAQCPVAPECSAFAAGRQDEMPAPRKRAAVVPVSADYAVVWRHAPGIGELPRFEVLVGRRPAQGRWAGLWEPPGAEGHHARARLDRWLGDHKVRAQTDLGLIVHVLTHRRYEVTARAAQHAGTPDLSPLGYVDARWLPVDHALGRTSGLSRLAQRLVERWQDQATDLEPAHPDHVVRRRGSVSKS
jgi:A/G-specific adenine glycosylase